ncbi:MAG: hypothetical protein KAT71_07390 [Gammaproteobacteria bacterium]|nr:hypothetical protein [Gammaproteobacteria bacterium]
MKEKVGDILRDNCWKQGFCLYLDENHDLVKKKIFDRAGLYIVITHDCDILRKKVDDDPSIEVICAVKIEKADGNYTSGQHPREMHVPVMVNDSTEYYKCYIRDKYIINKKHLTTVAPSSQYVLGPKTKESFIKWIIKGYNRSAFPDAFNKRMSAGVRKQMKNIIKNYVSDVHHGIFVSLSSYEELDDAEPYVIEIYILAEPPIEDKKFKRLENDAGKIEQLIEQHCNKIDVDRCVAKRLSKIDVATYFDLCSWDFEYLSFRR